MAYYLVKAKVCPGKLADLQERLHQDEIKVMRPFGTALDYSLKNARITADGWAIWEEEDYCRPSLAMERTAVLDDYFNQLSVEKVEQGQGWAQIESLRSLWAQV